MNDDAKSFDYYEARIDKHFDPCLDEISLILKAHLLFEEMLRDFCSSLVNEPKYLLHVRLTYAQIAGLARALDPISEVKEVMSWIWSVVDNLNKMRNLMAHAIEPDAAKFALARQSIINVVEQNSGMTPVPDAHEALCNALGYTLGMLTAKNCWVVDKTAVPTSNS